MNTFCALDYVLVLTVSSRFVLFFCCVAVISSYFNFSSHLRNRSTSSMVRGVKPNIIGQCAAHTLRRYQYCFLCANCIERRITLLPENRNIKHLQQQKQWQNYKGYAETFNLYSQHNLFEFWHTSYIVNLYTLLYVRRVEAKTQKKYFIKTFPINSVCLCSMQYGVMWCDLSACRVLVPFIRDSSLSLSNLVPLYLSTMHCRKTMSLWPLVNFLSVANFSWEGKIC